MFWSLLLPLAAQAAAQPPAPDAPPGRETVIPFAGGGNLREWTYGEAADVLYVRDRREHWYRVTLTGPVVFRQPLNTLSYTTDPDNRFDRFQRLRFLRQPAVSYGVRSITASAPPPGRQGTRDLPRR